MKIYSLFDSLPDLWNTRYLVVFSVAAVSAATVAVLRSGGDHLLLGLAALLAAVLGVLGAVRLQIADAAVVDPDVQQPARTVGYLLTAGGLIVALAALASAWKSPLDWVIVPMPYLLVLFCPACFRIGGRLATFTLPVALGLMVLGAAVLEGDSGAGGFPAVLVFLLAMIGLTTRRLELRIRAEYAGDESVPVHLIHNGTLAWISTVFFFFGVVTIWPWLGKLYSAAYLWILLIGVLWPLLFFWSRIKQPRSQTAIATLIRFNRLIPYIGLILLLAIIIG